jgi:hypothetical protein
MAEVDLFADFFGDPSSQRDLDAAVFNTVFKGADTSHMSGMR